MGGRKSFEVFVLCMLFCILLLPFRATSLKTYTSTVTVTPTTRYNGIADIQVTGSIPNQMGNNRRGFFGAVFWNPTENIYQITRVEFNASDAVNEVFNGLEQGIGRSYPTSGWVYDDISKKGVYLAQSVLVQPHTSQEFYVRIKPNKKSEVFSVQLRITANGTVYEQSYATRQQPDASPVSVLWLGQGPEPQFVISEPLSTERTFYVTLQEDSNKIKIDSGGTLTIDIPKDFTNIEDINGAGWGTAIITGNRIEVPNTVAFTESHITYAFNASTPATQGLYMLNAAFNGTPDEHPIGNFSIRITDGSTP